MSAYESNMRAMKVGMRISWEQLRDLWRWLNEMLKEYLIISVPQDASSRVRGVLPSLPMLQGLGVPGETCPRAPLLGKVGKNMGNVSPV
jgi:hypothetical protein